jgi:hypothetical protein
VGLRACGRVLGDWNTGCLVNHQNIGCTSAAAAAAMDYYACQVKTELVSREPKAWCLRPEDKVIITSFDHKANRTIIASSTVTVAQLQLYGLS